jgi:hypothetical protein
VLDAKVETALRVMSPPGSPSLTFIRIWLPHPADRHPLQRYNISLFPFDALSSLSVSSSGQLRSSAIDGFAELIKYCSVV